MFEDTGRCMRKFSGKVKLVRKNEGETIEQLCERVVKDSGEYEASVEASEENYVEILKKLLSDKYVVVDDELYDITGIVSGEAMYDMILGFKDRNGDINVSMHCFDDDSTTIASMVEIAINKANKSEWER